MDKGLSESGAEGGAEAGAEFWACGCTSSLGGSESFCLQAESTNGKHSAQQLNNRRLRDIVDFLDMRRGTLADSVLFFNYG
jgi:hypothetical protein